MDTVTRERASLAPELRRSSPFKLGAVEKTKGNGAHFEQPFALTKIHEVLEVSVFGKVGAKK